MDPINSGNPYLDETSQYLKETLDRIKDFTVAAPQIQAIYDQCQWQIGVYNNCPQSILPAMQSGGIEAARQSCEYIKNAIPLPPAIDLANLMKTMAVYTSGTNTVMQKLEVYCDVAPQESIEFMQFQRSEFESLQKAQQRPEQVRAMIARLGQSTLERFDRALVACNQVRTHTGNETAAAAEIRTLLDGVKGELMNKARRNPGENLFWQDVPQRLGKNAAEESTFRVECARRDKFCDDLTNLFKDRGEVVTRVEYLWPRVLDHLFTVLSLAT